MLRLEPFRFSNVLCDRFVVARRNPLLNAVSREIGPVGRFRRGFEWDHRKCVNFPMKAQSRVARTCSNSLDGHVTRLGERRVNRLADEVLLGFARQDAPFILSANANSADIGTPEGFQPMRPELESVTASGFNLYLGEQRVVPAQTTAQLKDSKNVEILLRFRRTNATQLRLLPTFLERFPLGHREFLSVQTESGASLGEAMLSAKKNAFQLARSLGVNRLLAQRSFVFGVFEAWGGTHLNGV
jgi:hypothetical protein